MREIIAICRSEKNSRDRVARVLDRYLWRIGDRTWRGRATNACLDRVSKELRKRATRNTAVVIYEIRSAAESRRPLVRIGSRHAFSEDGVVPVSSHPAAFRRATDLRSGGHIAAALGVAALFHDLGKATQMFQGKLRRALAEGKPEADPVRHELFSAAVWDRLVGGIADTELGAALQALTIDRIDTACAEVIPDLIRLVSRPNDALEFRFLSGAGLSNLIGLLILTHHRLPQGEADHVTSLAERHVRGGAPCKADDLWITPGTPFWHEDWWQDALRTEAGRLLPGPLPASADIALRAALMFADHLGSAKKTPSEAVPDHLANTIKAAKVGGWVAADSLSRHVRRVHRYARFAYEMTHTLRDRYPALDEAALPSGLTFPERPADPRFAWQAEAARAARGLCAAHEGGFFAAILAGTGTGKTRGAPTILAGAAMGDAIPERRYFRISLGLGLRVLATQSGREYLADLGFQPGDVATLVGDPPLHFMDGATPAPDQAGSESLLHLPEWLRVEDLEARVPEFGDVREVDWLRGLSVDTDRGLPAFLEMALEASGARSASGRRMLQTPILVGTIDHLMGVAAPVSARFLLQAVRMMTSDLILDEIDQYDGEDLAVIARLVFQAGASGRRVMIMSATLTPDIAQALHEAYARGWADYARGVCTADRVNLLVCGDAPGAVFTNGSDETVLELLSRARATQLAFVQAAPALRRGEVLAPCEIWKDLVDQIDLGCSRLHEANAVEIGGVRVSVGLVRMTRIAHAAALTAQLRSGDVGGRLRVLVCLHSQMPRLHRAYIETRLKRALTRKGSDPERGLRSLCEAEGAFERAAAIGVRGIEIVVVSTPVIETGNDVDFDWAILDPISTRSIIQSAGRVRRHRPARDGGTNVLILGRSPVAMQEGTLRMPGVETRPATDTRVPVIGDLNRYEGRYFRDLAGQADFSVITAAPLLDDGVAFPLRDAEARLRGMMISLDTRDPLGAYLTQPAARWNLAMTRSRRFRRSETGEVQFCLIGEEPERAEWHLDLAPGRAESALRAAGTKLSLHDLSGAYPLFEDLTEAGWRELTGGATPMTASDLRELMRVSLPVYGDDMNERFSYSTLTGFTRGNPEDLFKGFGKTVSKHGLTGAV
jgi:CRISPR-associated endonuclease/helicase Cas3